LIALAVLAFGADAAASGGASVAQQASLTGNSNSFFGYSVAASGNTVVVGAWNDAGGKGAAYVYLSNGASWTLQQELTASDGASGDQFGYAVAISGNTVLVGAANKANGQSNPSQGYVYAFARSGGTWAQQAEFTSLDGAGNDCFGCSIAVSVAAGGTAAWVGAPGRLGSTGAAYAFTSNGASWTQADEFVGQASAEYFGFAVAVSSEATTAVAGAFGANSSQGDAYVFTQSGGVWSQQAVLTASDGAAGDSFGYSVGVDSGTILVGAYANDGKGAAYAFTGSGASWSQQAKLVASDGAAGDDFGYAVALSGNTAAVGAYQKNSTGGPGQAYVFTDSAGSWSEQELPPQGAYFGYAVAASGTTVVASALAGYSGEVAIYAPATPPPPPAAPALGHEVGLLAMALLVAAGGVLRTRPTRGGIAL
jgi:hypothetical protein